MLNIFFEKIKNFSKKMLTSQNLYAILHHVLRRYLRKDKCASGSVVEHLLAKERVAGSSPVSRFLKTERWYRMVSSFLLYRKVLE